MNALEKKIEAVVKHFDKLDEQRGSPTPDGDIIRKAAETIKELETNEENWYRQEAENALPIDCGFGIANRMLGEARMLQAERKYGEAKKVVKKILALEDLEEYHSVKSAARELLNDISNRIYREYNHTLNAPILIASKIQRLKELLEAVDQEDKWFLNIQQAITTLQNSATEED